MKKFLFSSFRNNLTIIIGLGFFSIFSSVFSLVLTYFNGVFLDVILKKPDIKIIYKFANRNKIYSNSLAYGKFNCKQLYGVFSRISPIVFILVSINHIPYL